jgi:methyl-accepting chemotaxis protein
MKDSTFNPLKRSGLLGGSTMIADRLSGLVRVSLIAFGAVTFVYLTTVVISIQRATTQRELGTLSVTLADFKADLLQMRRNEKDFFERRTKAELENHAKHFADSIAALKRATDNPVATDADNKAYAGLEKAVVTYNNSFLAAAEKQAALGLDENSGLQGALRKSVREAEDLALKQGSPDLEVAILTLRRHEKDFVLRERDQYVKDHAKALAEAQQLITTAKFDSVTKQRLRELLGNYEKSFGEFVAGTLDVNKFQAVMRAAARTAEEPVDGLVTDATQRQADIASSNQLLQFVVAFILSAALMAMTWLIWRALGSVRRVITESVGQLQNTVERVRQGEVVGADDGVTTEDEMGLVWKSVDGLLSDRLAAQKKAEAENETLNNSVISILQSVNQLSQRDLTARAPVTQDIIGTVSDSINALTDETSKVLAGVNRIAGQVATASGKVKSQGDLVSKTADDERLSVGRMIESINESTQNTNRLATLAEQSNVSAEQATQATNSALETVDGTVRGMESIRETIAETEKRIKRLGERSQEITGIVNLINTISERTHVLALNASMQAAVAGEAGRGFAVVAEEVQRLAESSRNATQQIGTLVGNIQLETNETINTVNRTIGQVVQGSEQAQKAGEQMRRTQQITAQLVAQVKRIAEASEEQKTMSISLLKSVQGIGDSTTLTSQQIGVQNIETESLLESARRLVESIAVFKLPQAA